MTKKEAQTCSQGTLVKLFADQITLKDEKSICFFLGAGASVSSGIKSGNRMAREWYEELNDKNEGTKWLEENKINLGNYGENYSKLFAERYRLNPDTGVKYLRNEIEGKKPGAGYDYLAQILSKGLHNIVITTNFDRLIEDALFSHADKAPLICAHESLSGFIEPNQKRPIIIKLHHDLLFSPKNLLAELRELSKDFEKALSSILSQHPLVVVGYGGHDESVIELLKKLKEQSKQPIYWCHLEGEEMTRDVKILLSEKDFLVKISGFDELMEALAKEYDLKLFDGIVKIGELPAIQSRVLHALELVEKYSTNIEEIRLAYENSLQHFETPELLNKYALFLQYRLEDFDLAKLNFEKCIDKSKTVADHNFNYATFLHHHGKDPSSAAEYYEKAVASDDANPSYNFGYATFLQFLGKNADADQCYKAALKIEEYKPLYNYHYASFLYSDTKNIEKAKSYFQRALDFDSRNAEYHWGFACFLAENVANDTEATDLFEKALVIDDTKVKYNVSYASWLLLNGQENKALDFLLRAKDLIKSNSENNELLLEVRFYLTVYYSGKDNLGLEEASEILDKYPSLLLANTNLTLHIAYLGTTHVNNISEIKKLADLITGQENEIDDSIIEASE